MNDTVAKVAKKVGDISSTTRLRPNCHSELRFVSLVCQTEIQSAARNDKKGGFSLSVK